MARSRVGRARDARASPTPSASSSQVRAPAPTRRSTRSTNRRRSSLVDLDAEDYDPNDDNNTTYPEVEGHRTRQSSAKLRFVKNKDGKFNMVQDIKRQVKLVTEQKILPDRKPEMEGYPMREWNIEVYLLNENGEEVPATLFNKVVYNLHPTFPNPVQTFVDPPFRCQNEGWGEFDMTIDLFAAEKGGKNSLSHDLNFAKPRYESKHTINFRNPNQALLALLRESGPIPGEDANGKRKDGDAKKRKRAPAVDFDKLGDQLVKLNEDDLLHVVQMIHDNKSDDSYTKNDIEAGEFQVDLMSLPDSLIRMLWDFVNPRT